MPVLHRTKASSITHWREREGEREGERERERERERDPKSASAAGDSSTRQLIMLETKAATTRMLNTYIRFGHGEV